MLATLLAATTKAADETWSDQALDSLPRVGELLTALLGAIALAGIVRGVYRRTMGRRRDRYGRLRRLGTNAQLSFFSSVLGEPPAMRRSFDSPVTDHYDDLGQPYRVMRTFTECVWIDRDFYVHAIGDEDESVHAYSVTTRSRRFHPKLHVPGGSFVERRGPLKSIERLRWRVEPNPAVKLGTTRFAEFEPPGQAASWVGAHNAHYFEAYWYGNPGYYQHFVFSINDAGVATEGGGFGDQFMHTFSWGFEGDVADPQLAAARVAAEADVAAAAELAGAEEDIALDAFNSPEPDEAPRPPQWQAFRRRARVNTYTVIGPELALDDYPLVGDHGLREYPTAFGVNSGRVRTLE